MAKNIPNPHDRLFRQMMKHPGAAADVARNVLSPEIVALVDWERLQPVDCGSVDEELAEAMGSISYEVLTNVSDRVPRVFYEE